MQRAIDNLYSDFIAKRTYSRWVDEKGRRESWHESVHRFRDFFTPRVPEALKDKFAIAIGFLEDKQVMPSMRALWSAGPALEQNHLAAFNCAFMTIDSEHKFGEFLYILMQGTGMGFSVERQFIQKVSELPREIVEQATEETFIVQDSKLGWKEAVDHCVKAVWAGRVPKFDLSLVRPKGARLKTFGGRASGPEPLQQLLTFIVRSAQRAQGRRFNSVELHDICTKIAECVVVGGVEAKI